MVPGNHDPECGTGQLFGAALRSLREQKGIGLGEMAARVGMSAPYLCNIELGKFPPPSEVKLCAIAHDLGHNSDELLAKAGKTASDLSIIINKYPRQFAAILRRCAVSKNRIFSYSLTASQSSSTQTLWLTTRRGRKGSVGKKRLPRFPSIGD